MVMEDEPLLNFEGIKGSRFLNRVHLPSPLKLSRHKQTRGGGGDVAQRNHTETLGATRRLGLLVDGFRVSYRLNEGKWTERTSLVVLTVYKEPKTLSG